jgi:hypothetical protein
MLVQLGVCPMKSVIDMVAVMKKYALDDTEYGPDEKEVSRVYGSFLTAVEQNSPRV